MPEITPNWFAYGALLTWPLVVVYLYSTRPVGEATIWTVLAGYLLLPVGTVIKFEGIPPLDKNSIPNLAALIGCVVVARRMPRVFHRFGLAEIFIIALLVSPFITSEFNTDPITVGETTLPGLDRYEALSAVVNQFLFFLPFILARQFLRTSSDTMNILRILVVAGLAYSVLILFEVRMSPQLHGWIYGYFPHSFVQQIRDGGFRAAVFVGHGLAVAFFVMTAAVAAAALWRAQIKIVRLPLAGVTVYLTGVLILCKTLGALVYGAVLVPLVRWATPRLQLRAAVVLAALALTYPVLRTMDLVPTGALLETASMVSDDRAGSLSTRFEQEQVLLEHAWQRPLFGWGRFGRNRVFDEDGRDISTTDGRWIIVLGTFGLVGFLAEFGLLALSVFRAAAALRFADTNRDKGFLAALALIVAINMIDLLPNATLSPWTWLLAGALLGHAEALRAVRRVVGATNQATLGNLRSELARGRAPL